MTLEGLRELAKANRLILNRRELNPVYREKGYRGQRWDRWDGNEATQPIWDTTLIKCKRYQYEARTPDMPEHQLFKITKKDYEELKGCLQTLDKG